MKVKKQLATLCDMSEGPCTTSYSDAINITIEIPPQSKRRRKDIEKRIEETLKKLGFETDWIPSF
jgi:hypothetical protein